MLHLIIKSKIILLLILLAVNKATKIKMKGILVKNK